jgi:hypothetical protein
MTRIDSHWVLKGDTAQVLLEAAGYTEDKNARGRKGWVLMVKTVEEDRK